MSAEGVAGKAALPPLTPRIIAIPNPPPSPRHGPISIIYAGLMRMGSLSIAHAFATLGFRTHHLLETGWDDWTHICDLASATFPKAGEKSAPPRRSDWEKLLGGYDAVTDLAGYFVPQLLEAYPDAKVVLVQRDFDKWWHSYYNEVSKGNFPESRMEKFLIGVVFGGIGGVKAAPAMKRILQGWFRADDLEGIKRNARRRYEEHYEWVRRNVPRERLLEYKLGDGWEPLCAFLEVEVPEVEFPRVNDAVEHQLRTTERLKWLLPLVGRRMGTFFAMVVALAVVWMALLSARSQAGVSRWGKAPSKSTIA
jgi:hypothetical protein